MTKAHFLEPVLRRADPRIREALIYPMGVPGVYGRTAAYEAVLEGLSALISQYRDKGSEVLRFPPVMSRRDLEHNGYLKSFPNLIGCACALHGSEADIWKAAELPASEGGWTSVLQATDLVLSPAACYPLYPIVASRGSIPTGGLLFDVAADCFRREPSSDLDRLQSFRMREYVCIGTADEVEAFRNDWLARAAGLAEQLGLPFVIDHASDPFFGRVGQIKAVSQVQSGLKFELLVPLHSVEKPTACMSFNYHKDHFGARWAIRHDDGSAAHSGCVAFGMDRLTVALFWIHGLEIGEWPHPVRATLGL